MTTPVTTRKVQIIDATIAYRIGGLRPRGTWPPNSIPPTRPTPATSLRRWRASTRRR